MGNGTRFDYLGLLDEVRGVTWPAAGRVGPGVSGAHASRTRGTSGEFDEYRPCRQGANTRRIDWKLFARTERAFVRVSREPAVFTSRIILDATASMAFPADTLSKWRLASSLALCLIAVARATGDPAGLTLVHSDVERGTARIGAAALSRALNMIERMQPTGSSLLAPEIARAARPGTRVVLISDFLGDAADALDAARGAVANRCDVHAVHVIDQLELVPDTGSSAFVHDPEDIDTLRPLDAGTLEHYHATFAEWRTGLAREWRNAGVHFHTAVAGRQTAPYLTRQIAAHAVATSKQ